jgi:hypothetical protein
VTRPALLAWRSVATLLPLAVVGLLSGCAKPVDSAACHSAPTALLDRLQQHLVVGGKVRDAVVLKAAGSGPVFISFENRTERQAKRDRPGHILTLMTADLDTGDLSAVDGWAHKETDLPPASVTLKAPAAVESRGCVAARRAK